MISRGKNELKKPATSKRQLSKCHSAHHNYTHSKGKRSTVKLSVDSHPRSMQLSVLTAKLSMQSWICGEQLLLNKSRTPFYKNDNSGTRTTALLERRRRDGVD